MNGIRKCCWFCRHLAPAFALTVLVVASTLANAQLKPATPDQAASPAGGSTTGNDQLPMTRAQGDAILEELRRLESLLAAHETAREAPGSSAATAGPVRMRIPVDKDSYTLGSQDAHVVVIEFVDLECQFCRRFQATTFEELKADYIDTKKVRFVHRDLPLPAHEYARLAASAARCAGAQGKFWQFRDAVLAMDMPPTPEELNVTSARLGLNASSFEQCQKSHQFEAKIRGDEDIATSAGINGTPTFVIGREENGWVVGSALRGNRPYAAFRALIDGSLATAQSQNAMGMNNSR